MYGVPISSVEVAADAAVTPVIPRFFSMSRNMNSAIGERHMLPWQTNSILYISEFLSSILQFIIAQISGFA